MKINLPQTNTVRWNASKKYAVVTAINLGLLTVHDAATRYRLSPEELRSWSVMLDNFGVQGLHATAAKRFRDKLRDAA